CCTRSHDPECAVDSYGREQADRVRGPARARRHSARRRVRKPHPRAGRAGAILGGGRPRTGERLLWDEVYDCRGVRATRSGGQLFRADERDHQRLQSRARWQVQGSPERRAGRDLAREFLAVGGSRLREGVPVTNEEWRELLTLLLAQRLELNAVENAL